MLTHLTRAQLLRLAEPASEPCLSVYLLVEALVGQLQARGLASAASDLMLRAVLELVIDQEQWGSYNQQTGHIQLHTERQTADEDLLNLIALEAIRHGGSPYAVPADAVPGGGPCAALLRRATRTGRSVPWFRGREGLIWSQHASQLSRLQPCWPPRC